VSPSSASRKEPEREMISKRPCTRIIHQKVSLAT
jgi:hypothetical protein